MKFLLLLIILMTSLAAIASDDAPSELENFSEEATEKIKRLATSLKTELSAAMQSGGPSKAIEVCNIEAPVITSELNSNSNMQIKRTSLKIRNPDNAPDEWEIMVLNQFEDQLDSGIPVKQLNFTEVSEQEGIKTFRMMRAIPVGGVCLACHGPADTLPKEVKQALKEKYPNDQATGYSAGQLRGAFSVTETFPSKN
ncbi:MAG: DUF3365 domain-containing protein [Pseudomonadota bacterium]